MRFIIKNIQLNSERLLHVLYCIFYPNKFHNFFKKLYLQASTKIDLCPRDLSQRLVKMSICRNTSNSKKYDVNIMAEQYNKQKYFMNLLIRHEKRYHSNIYLD